MVGPSFLQDYLATAIHRRSIFRAHPTCLGGHWTFTMYDILSISEAFLFLFDFFPILLSQIHAQRSQTFIDVYDGSISKAAEVVPEGLDVSTWLKNWSSILAYSSMGVAHMERTTMIVIQALQMLSSQHPKVSPST